MRKLDKNLTETLRKTKYFLLDLDGTLYLENKPIGDMKNTLKFLRDKGKKLIYLTNNSSKGAHTYVEKLKNIGFYEEGDLVYSSGVATIEYLNRYYKGKSVCLLGTESYRQEMINGGINVVDGDRADVAVLSYDTELSYKKLCNFVRAIHFGATYIATHPDVNCPAEDVYLPDAGSFIKMIETALGYTPKVVIGKPNNIMGENLKAKFLENDDLCFMMVGDRLYTDIAFGKNCNFPTMLVLSGETTEDMIPSAEKQPDFILESFNDVKNYF